MAENTSANGPPIPADTAKSRIAAEMGSHALHYAIWAMLTDYAKAHATTYGQALSDNLYGRKS